MSSYRTKHHHGAGRDVRHLAGPLLGLVAAALVVTIMFEVEGGGGSVPFAEQGPMPAPAPQPLTLAVSPERDNGRQQVERLLARPLLSQNRRPPADVPVSAVVEPWLPRLAGVVVSSAGGFAIFANAEGGKPTVVREGDQVGVATIETVSAGQVTLRGPAGLVVLHTTFEERVLQASRPNLASLQRSGYRPRQGGHDAAMLNSKRVANTY